MIWIPRELCFCSAEGRTIDWFLILQLQECKTWYGIQCKIYFAVWQCELDCREIFNIKHNFIPKSTQHRWWWMHNSTQWHGAHVFIQSKELAVWFSRDKFTLLLRDYVVTSVTVAVLACAHSHRSWVLYFQCLKLRF